MKSKLQIALVVAETAPIPDVLGGGAERLVTMLINQNEIDKRVKFIVFSTYDRTAKKESLKYNESEFIYIKENNIFTKMYNGAVRAINKCISRRLLKKGYYKHISDHQSINFCDLIIDQNGYVPEIGYLTLKRGKERLLAHVHWKVSPKEQKIDGLYGGVIGVSRYITDFWKNNTSDDSLSGMVVYSAVDEKRFTNQLNDEEKQILRNKYNISSDDIVFIYCGRLHEQKGVLELIKAFHAVRDSRAKLMIVGGSALLNTKPSKYEEKVHCAARKDARIIFTGYISNEELYRFYHAADVQVIPTKAEEAAGLVAIEGMLTGLPIIAANSGGLPEYIDENCSIVVERDKDQIKNLSGAINEMLNDKEKRKRMSLAAAVRGKSFSQRKYYNNFIDCLEEYYSKAKK